MGERLVLGKVVVADKVVEKMKENNRYYNFVFQSLGRYMHLDWGITDEHGKDLNASGLLHDGPIRALYGRNDEDKIIVTTDAHRQMTTVTFASDIEN